MSGLLRESRSVGETSQRGIGEFLMAGRLEMANGTVRRGMNARLTGGWVAWMITSPGRDRDLGACIGTGIDVYLWMDMTGRIRG